MPRDLSNNLLDDCLTLCPHAPRKKLIESGEISHVKVGTHHRIPAQAILEFQRARTARREEAAQALAAFSNEIGLVD